MSAPPPSQKDAQQVLRYAFEDDTGRIRVDAVISPSGTDLEIHNTDDSIAIGTSTELFTATDIGPKVGLDVNIINTLPLDVDISAASGDNIAIANQAGTQFLAVNPDGSINITDNGGSLTVDGSVAITNFPATQSVTQGTTPWVVSGTVAATQSGTWDINNISGTISLPTGASTSANQATEIASLASIDSKLSSPITVTGPLTDAQLRATPVTVTANAGTNLNTSALALDTTVAELNVALEELTQSQGSTTSGQVGPLVLTATTTSAPTYVTATSNPLSTTTSGLLRVDGSGVTQPVSGTVTANAGSGTFLVDGSAHTQPVSGTVTVNQGTSPWVVSGTVTATPTGTQDVNIVSSVELEIKNDVGNPIPVSGTVTANAGTGNFTVTQSSGANLHVNVDNFPADADALAQGSTTSGQLGSLNLTATTTAAPTYVNATTNPLSTTLSGALRVDGSAVIQPVSGTVTANAGTGTFLVDGSAHTQPVSGTVTVNQGTSPWVVSGTVTTTNSDDHNYGTVGANTLRTAAQIGNATGAADFNAGATGAQTLRVTANAGVNLNTSALALDTTVAGLLTNTQLRATPVPVSGTVTVSNFPTTLDTNYGTVGANTLRTAAEIGNATGAADFNAGATGAQTLRVTANAGVNLNTSALALDTSVTELNVALEELTQAQASTTSGQVGPLVLTATTTAAPTYTTATSNPLSTTTAGALRVDGSAVTQPISGSVSVSNFPADADAYAQASTTSGQLGNLTMGAVTTAAPTYTTAQTDPLSLTTAGALRVDNSAVTQPVRAGTGTLTDRSGTATSASTQMMAANANRKYLFIQNLGNSAIYINFTSAAVAATAGSIQIGQFGSFVMEDTFVSTEAINVIRSGGSNLAFTAKEG